MIPGRRRAWRWENYETDFRLLATVAWVLLGGMLGILVAYAVATWLIVGSGT
jgi:hypothetical protein